MEYRIDIIDTWHRRIASFTDVPLLRATRSAPDRPDVIEGVLPGPIADLGAGYLVRVFVDGVLFTEAPIVRVTPQWSDTRKLVLDRFVYYHEVIEFEAAVEALTGNTKVSRAFINRPIHEIVKSVVNTALGPVHYTVAHTAYPDGAQREGTKFDARRTAANELGIGSITTGQWVAAARIDAMGAFAKDGDTIAGLVVDGIAWPDLRLMMIDSEETTRNSHAISRHGEVAAWTDPQYAASGYKLKAEAAKSFLQSLIDTRGIDYIELNPHRDASGAFDDRIDAFGRYLGFVYGDGQCFNAAMVESGNADVYHYNDGKYHVPEMELKDYFSYTAPHADSIENAVSILADFDIAAGLYEVLTALAYAAGGYVWSVGSDWAVSFRRPLRPDRVDFFSRLDHAATLESDARSLSNALVITGNPQAPAVDKLYTNGASIGEYDFRLAFLDYFSLATVEDADKLAAGLLEDVAYPTRGGELTYLHGASSLHVGEIIELRGGDVRRLDREVAGEWGGRFAGRNVGRAATVTHEFRGAWRRPRLRSLRPCDRSTHRCPLSFAVNRPPPRSSSSGSTTRASALISGTTSTKPGRLTWPSRDFHTAKRTGASKSAPSRRLN